MHGSTQHIGKVPSRAGREMTKKNELMQLREGTGKKSVEKGDMRRAADLRG